MDGFRISRRDDGERTVVAVEGEVDLATAPRLKEFLLDLVAEGVTEVVLDLSGVDFLDSTGLGAVVAAFKRVRAHDGHMAVVVTSARVRRAFEITNLDRVLSLTTSVDPEG